MKKILIGLFVCIGLIATTQQTKAQYASVSFQLFYDELSPYGMWVNTPDYGYVWVPDVGNSFQPYSSEGYWAYTNAGWTWVSNYPWGWAPFHYGRWYYDNGYGYVWIPGNQWGPAWVNWRHSAGYYGWTPLGPGYGYGYATSYTAYTPPAERWIFVRERDFGRTNINNYYVDRSTNVTIINKSTVINNSIVNKGRNENYIAGPTREQVQKVTGKSITTYQVEDNAKPGLKVNNTKVEAYRPKIENMGGGKPAPSKVASEEESRKFIGNRNDQRSPNSAQPISKEGKLNNTPAINGATRQNKIGNTEPMRKPNKSIDQAKPANKYGQSPGNGNMEKRKSPERIPQNNKQGQMRPERIQPNNTTAPSNDLKQGRPSNIMQDNRNMPQRKQGIQQPAPQQDFRQTPPVSSPQSNPPVNQEPFKNGRMQQTPNNAPMQQAPQNPPPQQMQKLGTGPR